jgi:hypothetical protein
MSFKKNPVNQALGLVIKKERELRSWDYEQLAKKSNISANYLRSIEQGSFNLHVSKALSLYEAFKQENEAIGDSFSLEGLIHIISLTAIMETKVNETIKWCNDREVPITYQFAVSGTAEELSKLNSKFNAFFSKFFSYKIFEKETSEEVAKIIETTGLLSHVEDFIVNYSSFGMPIIERQQGYIDDFLNNVPSIYLNLLEDIKQNLTALPARLPLSNINKWEEKNYRDFEEINYFITDFYRPHDDMQNHYYSYLWEKKFQKLNFYYAGDVNIADDLTSGLKDPFIKYIQEEYIKKYSKSEQHFDIGVNKVHFKDIHNLNKNFLALFDELKTKLDSDKKYNTLIIYKLSSLKYIGFLADSSSPWEYLDTLKVADVRTTINVLKDLVSI